MKKITLLFFLSTTLTIPVLAKEKGLFSSALWYDNTSDGINASQFEVKYRNHRRNIFWNYGQAEKRSLDWGIKGKVVSGNYKGDDFQGLSLKGLLGFKSSPDHYTEGQVGINSLTNKTDDNSTMIPWSLKHDAKLGPFSTTGTINHNLFYAEYGMPGAADEFLYFTDYKLDVHFQPHDNFRIPLMLKQRFYSDNNERFENSLALYYGRYSTLSMWVGLSFNYLNSKLKDEEYWTPKDRVSIGPVFEFSYSFRKLWGLSGQASIAHVKEGDNKDWSTLLSGSWKWGNRNSWEAGVGFVRIDSERVGEGDNWDGTQFKIFGTYSI